MNIYREIIKQNRVNNLVKHFTIFLIFSLVGTIIFNPPHELKNIGIMMSILYIPLFLLTNNRFIMKAEIYKGNLELLLTTSSPVQIILTKFVAISCNILLSMLVITPIVAVFFSLSVREVAILSYSVLMIATASSAVVVFIASIQSYFHYNTNFLAIMVMPLLFPNILLSGMSFDTEGLYILYLMLGINLVLIPLCLSLSAYLVGNIYNR